MERELPERELIVRKANELIQKSRHNLSERQQKIILYLISHISPYDEDFKDYVFDIKSFCNVCDIDETSGGNYEEIKTTIKEIADLSVWIRLENEQETLFRWIERPIIDARSGKITMRFNELLRPYLLQLTGNYTQYDLIYAVHFKSKYTIRLYELLKSVHYHELEPYTTEFNISYLRQRLGADDKPSFDKYSLFKSKVLMRAITEINLKSDKTVEYEEIKLKNKVVRISFTIKTKLPEERMRIVANIIKK